jgi:hypothetical protein
VTEGNVPVFFERMRETAKNVSKVISFSLHPVGQEAMHYS